MSQRANTNKKKEREKERGLFFDGSRETRQSTNRRNGQVACLNGFHGPIWIPRTGYDLLIHGLYSMEMMMERSLMTRIGWIGTERNGWAFSLNY